MNTTEQAVIDATRTQESILQQCTEAGISPPPYVLRELVGKGSFGRVYKAIATSSGQVVAVKTISIEEGDRMDPRTADTIGDILKEVGALKLLSESGAKNINTIIDTFVLGHSVWMVTEYAAGSVATLMKPTGYLSEKWAIPILREAAEAIYWVHNHGIIHRDIKCANVLVTEAGGVQLCDFGVAGILATKFDKRRTVTGTLHWMAPELFDNEVRYGKEIDIWAFGAMAYELTLGEPPNARRVIDQGFGAYLKHNCPRLHGDQYSTELKDLVASCMVEDPERRLTIEQVQGHAYIFDTNEDFPTASLSQLLAAYRVWQSHGGTRQSLFNAVGAHGIADPSSSGIEDWDFDNDDEQESNSEDARIMRDAYGLHFPASTAYKPERRRRLPPDIPRLKAPLEKVFDPNTLSNYEDNARVFYHGSDNTPQSDLPLRKDSDPKPIRESLIDLDDALAGGDLSQFADLETIRPRPHSSGTVAQSHRKTLDWTFPKSVPASAPLEVEQLRSTSPPADIDNRLSATSLIDLDASLAPDSTARPSTTSSDGGSASFGLDQWAFQQGMPPTPHQREPSIFVTDEFAVASSTVVASKPSLESSSQLSVTTTASPPMPLPPSAKVMDGSASRDEVKGEFERLLLSLKEHLQETSDILSNGLSR